MRGAGNQAANAATTASNTGAGYGANASTIGSTLAPFEMRQLTAPSGMSQQDIGQQLTAGLGGAGGATSAIQGALAKNASATRNPMGFSAALDSAARSRDKAAAQTGEDIAAKNVDVKLGQQKTAGDILSNMYGTDVRGQMEATGQIAPDVNAEVAANKTGWLQNLQEVMGMIKPKYSGGSFSAGG